MAQNANSQRLVEICGEVSTITARLRNAAAAVKKDDVIKADTLTKAADEIGKAFDSLWNTAGAIGKNPDPVQSEWARLLTPNAKPLPVSGE